MEAILVETALESPVVDDGFDMDKPSWQMLHLRALHENEPRIEGQGASSTPRLGKYRAAHEYRQARRTVHRTAGLLLAKLFKAKKMALSLLPARPSAECSIRRLLGSCSEPHRFKGQANPFALEKQYNPETRASWSKSSEAIGKDRLKEICTPVVVHLYIQGGL